MTTRKCMTRRRPPDRSDEQDNIYVHINLAHPSKDREHVQQGQKTAQIPRQGCDEPHTTWCNISENSKRELAFLYIKNLPEEM